jgi:hypothetical protein
MGQIDGVFIGTSTTKLSLAVYLIDDYTGRGIGGNLDVSIKGRSAIPIRNPSGYYLFFDLPAGSHTVQVKGGEHYFDQEEMVRPADLDELNPVVNIDLKPAPSYSFPSTATLIRGHLEDSLGRGIPEAVLRIKGSDTRTMTTDNGEFLIYFKGLRKGDVTIMDGVRFVKINEKNPILEIKHPDYKERTKTVEVREGTVTSLSITYP